MTRWLLWNQWKNLFPMKWIQWFSKKNCKTASTPSFPKADINILPSVFEFFHKICVANRKFSMLDFGETWFSALKCSLYCILWLRVYNAYFLIQKIYFTVQFGLWYQVFRTKRVICLSKIFLFFTQQTLELSWCISSKRCQIINLNSEQ